MTKIIVNAIGDQCPVPVMKTLKVMKELTEPGIIEVQVDNEIAVSNLTRLANSRQAAVASEKKEEKLYIVTITVENLQPEEGPSAAAAEAAAMEGVICCTPAKQKNTVVVIGSDCMGSGDDELGRTLMKGFIYALTQLDPLPKTILFYNGGVKLTVNGAVSVEDLKSMEAQGVQILACGTCLNYYGLTEQLAVGSVTNMYAIAEAMNGADKVIRP